MGLLGIIERVRNFPKRLSQSRWPRRLGITALVIVLLWGLIGFVGVPFVLKRVLSGQVAASIHRTVTVEKIRFNPYKLRLEADHLHISDRNPQRPFVDLGHLRVKVSWKSLFRLAPIVGEFYTDQLAVHIVRTGEKTFNFSDLMESSPPPASPPPPSKPFRFAVSNIVLNQGAISFDDELLGQQHSVDHIRLALPFIADLPADTDIYAQPFLQMVVDGSRFHLNGETKPFQDTLDTSLNFSFHLFDLTRYIAYVPVKMPVKLKNGLLSTVLSLHFLMQDGHPHVRLDGAAALDQIQLEDQSGVPLLTLRHAVAELDKVEPLENIVHLKRIYLTGLASHLVREPDGSTNLSTILASTAQPPSSTAGSPVPTASATSLATTTATPAITATPTPSPTPQPLAAQAQIAAPAITPSAAPSSSPAESTPFDFALSSFQLTDSSIDLVDRSLPSPGTVALQGIHAKLDNLRTTGESTAPYEFGGNFGGGGTLTVKGNLELAKHHVSTDASIDQLDIPAFKAFAAPFLNGDLASGKLSAGATVKTDFTPGKLNVHVEPANAVIAQFAIHAGNSKEDPITWDRFSVALGQFDLASQQAVVNEVKAEGLKLAVRRDRQGQISLLSLMRSTPSSTPSAASAPSPKKEPKPHRQRRARKAAPFPASTPSAPATPQFQYRVAAVILDKAQIHAIDEHAAKPLKVDIAPLNISLKNISNDLAKPIGVALDAVINKGSLKIDGTAAPTPLDAKLRIAVRKLDLTAINSYLGDQLNATIAAARLTMNGTATASQHRDNLRAGYRGDLNLGGVRVLDKLTGDNFLHWNSFNASNIVADYGEGLPKVKIGGLALSNFYARIILRSDGKLNLKDIMANPKEAPKSLTRVSPEVVAPTPEPTPTPTAAAASTPAPAKPLPAEIAIGGITLEGGNVNYTDNFIQPHYTADLTDIGGKIGAFGTGSTTPADVALQGQVNGNAPLAINGSVNPLVPIAFIDLAAKANAIELPGLSPYSTKYTGYPIVKGSLNVDVHYKLENQNLSANNHIYIDQLTFGDKVESKDALNLPIRLAVSLLKDPKGVIDLNIPVSGSLNDPQFSIGGVIWQVVKNLIMKAVTAPFSLITGAISAVGGGGAAAEDLNYIVFDPGYAKLKPEALQKLNTIEKALSDRPAIKIDITGRVDPNVDRDGLREAKVEHKVEQQKIEDVGETEGGEPVTVGKDEYEKYLKKAYKAAKFEKPTNAIGLTKSLPTDEMKKLMLANTKVTDDDLRKLAEARADAVRGALSKKIDPGRIVVAPAKLSAEDIKDKGPTTRADLSLQ